MIAHVGKPGTLDDALNRIMVNGLARTWAALEQ
jgi:hypothetical protein